MSYNRLPEVRNGLRLHLNENTAGCSPAVLQAIAETSTDEIAFYPDYEPITAECERFFGVEPGHVFGVSILDEASKAKFAEKYNLNFPLLADTDHSVAEKYGVWQEKQNYGRSYMGIVRTTYLIGRDGKIARRWDYVKVDGHADDVLQEVKKF